MNKFKKVLVFILVTVLAFSVVACSPLEKDNSTNSNPENEVKEINEKAESLTTAPIMSSDRVMSNYFDISLVDEENYSDIYLGKKFDIQAKYAGEEFVVPTKLAKLAEMGWTMTDGNMYDENSLIFSYETVDVQLQNEAGIKISTQIYNSSRSTARLSECYVVKFIINNDFYTSPDNYTAFEINGINNTMAITDIINTLGTPSHFYAVAEDCYYLDYFISRRDRRNGITIYINPIDDSIISIEFSYYK